MNLFEGIKKDDDFAVYDACGNPVRIAKVLRLSASQFSDGFANFLLSSGKMVGDKSRYARPLTPEKKDEIEAIFEARKVAKIEQAIA